MSLPDGTQLRVVGLPEPQGSKGAKVMWGRNGKPFAQLFDTNHGRLMKWRRTVQTVAAHAAKMRMQQGLPQLDGPLHVSLAFRFPMPASRPRRVFDRGWCWKVSAPDMDKLTRAVGDALTDSKLIRDDARICSSAQTKVEVKDAHLVGVIIQVFVLNEDGEPVPVRPLSPQP